MLGVLKQTRTGVERHDIIISITFIYSKVVWSYIVSTHEKESIHIEQGREHEEVVVSDIPSRNTLRYIILGLVWTHPMTGYDIKQAFDRALASYWNAGNSQIYTTLKQLSQAGLVESEIIVQTTRPNRKVYRLTPAGQVELERWLEEDVPEFQQR